MGDISRSFSKHEFKCKCGCGIDFRVDDKLVKVLQAIRDEVGPCTITSGHRCKEHNAKVKGSKRSWHVLRKGVLYAADIQIMDPRRRTLKDATRIYCIADLNDAHGLGLYHNRCHVDTRPITIFKGADRARWIDSSVEWE